LDLSGIYSDKLKHITSFAIYIFVGICLYYFSFKNQFIFDDFHYIQNNPLIKTTDPQNLVGIFSSFYKWDYLPLTLFSFALEYKLFGLNPVGYHVTNFVLHILNCLLVHILIYHLTKSFFTTCLTSLFFLIHPVNVESVAWVSELKNLLSFLFFIAAFILFVQFQKKILSAFLFTLGLLAKVSIIILPLLLVLYEYCYTKIPLKKAIWDKWPFWFISLIFSAITLMSHSSGKGIKVRVEGDGIHSLYSMVVIFKEYLIKLFLPLNLNVWYADIIFISPLNLKVIWAFLWIVGFGLLLKIYRQKNLTIFFGLSWFLISLLPVSRIAPLAQMMADRWLYIPYLGLLLAIFSAIRVYAKKANFNAKNYFFLYVILGVLFTLNMSLSWERIRDFESNQALWEDSVLKSPNNPTALTALGKVYLDDGKFNKALPLFRKAQTFVPANPSPKLYMAKVYQKQMKFQKAEKIYLDVIKEFPGRSFPKVELGALYTLQSRNKEALNILNKTLETDPKNLAALNNKASILIKWGRTKEAVQILKKLVDEDSQNAFFMRQLASVYINQLNQPELGVFYLKKSLKLDPDSAETKKALSTLSD